MKIAPTLVLVEPRPDSPPDAAERVRRCNRAMRAIASELDELDDLATAVFVSASLLKLTTELASKVDPERARCALSAAMVATRVIETDPSPESKAKPS